MVCTCTLSVFIKERSKGTTRIYMPTDMRYSEKDYYLILVNPWSYDINDLTHGPFSSLIALLRNHK